jgi:hypothetical protein
MLSVEEALEALDTFLDDNETAPETRLIYNVLVAMHEQVTGVSDQVAGEAARQEALEEEVADGKRKRR